MCAAEKSVSSNDDPILRFIQKSAKEAVDIERIYLFGSRARGDAHLRSDYDLAVEVPNWEASTWSRWVLDLKERVPTLCGLDLVRVTPNTSPSLLEAVRSEGILIYERKS